MKIKMKNQKFTELTDSIIRGANISYEIDNTGISKFNPNFNSNHIKFGDERKQLEKGKDPKSLELLELHNMHSELAKEYRDKFNSADIVNASPEIQKINQEKWSNKTVIYANYQAFKDDKIGNPIMDIWTDTQEIEKNTKEQKINIPFVVHPDTLKEIKKALITAGQPRIDLGRGYIDHTLNTMSSPAKVNISVFALDIYILDNDGKVLKKIPIKFSEESEYNKLMGYTNDLLEHKQNQQVSTPQTNSQQPKKDEK